MVSRSQSLKVVMTNSVTWRRTYVEEEEEYGERVEEEVVQH